MDVDYLAELLADIQACLFDELQSEAPQIDPLRRQLQRHYLETLTSQLAAFEGRGADSLAGLLGDDPTLGYLLSSGQGTDLRAAARFNLAQLAEEIEAALPRVTDATTQAHLADLLNTIDGILSGRVFMYDSGSGGSDLSSLLGG